MKAGGTDMDKKYVLAIDQSTQGTKAVLVDEAGGLVCKTAIAHRQIVDRNGWVSHDIDEIYHNVVEAVRALVKKASIAKEEIACLGISNQRETAAAWSKKTGIPLAYAVVWQCKRADGICKRLMENGIEKDIRQKTGIPLSPYFTAAKYAWLQEYEENVKKAKERGDLCFGTMDTYLVYRLTGGSVYATDYSNASRTQLYNIHTLEWDEELCRWFGIDSQTLPRVAESGGRFGETDFEGFLAEPIPICAVMGDSQSALFGQGCIQKGMVKATYGTGSSVMMNIGETPMHLQNGLVTSIAWGFEKKIHYVFEGNINYSGAVVTWLKDDLGLIRSPKETQKMAYDANKEDSTYLIPAFSGLGAPYWKPSAKAAFWGMSRTTGRNELVKAALESIVYQITDVLELMKAGDDITFDKLHVDGGAIENEYLMQFQSDIAGIDVMLPKYEESSAMGAAYMAGIVQGILEKEQIFAIPHNKQYRTQMEFEERQKKYSTWKAFIEKM